MRHFLKKITPKSIFAKMMLIFILPTIVSQAIIIYIFIFNKSKYTESKMANDIVKQIILIKKNIENPIFSQEIEKLTGIEVFLIKNKRLSDNNLPPFPQNRIIKNFLDISFNNGLKISEIIYNSKKKLITIIIPHRQNNLILQFNKRKIFNPRNEIFIYWILSTTILMSVIAIIFTKNQLRSVKNLAKAVDKFDINENDIRNFTPSGPKEIKTLGISFLRMIRRIDKDIEEKKMLLSSISHDLRTPLARMKLSLEMMTKSDESQDLKQDVRDMEQMINQYLNYSAQNNQILMEELHLEEIENLIRKKYQRKNIKITSKIQKGKIIGNLVNINRIMDNLMNNSLKYGKNILVTLQTQQEYFILTVEDDGVGIPKNKFSEIIKPFYRLDNSRNLDSKNIGLGLAIVDKIVKEHSANIFFKKSKNLGGLKVEIKFSLI